MAGGSTRLSAVALVFLLLLSTNSALFFSDESPKESMNLSPEWVKFEVKHDVYFDAVGVLDETLLNEEREPLARSPFGTYDVNGLNLARPVPADLLEPRFDLLLLLVSNELRLQDVRSELSSIQGLAVREFIAPSGLMVQGTPHALQQATAHHGLLASHAVPLGMLLDGDLLDVVLLTEGEEALQQRLLRLDGWRDGAGPLEQIAFTDDEGGTLTQSLGEVAR